ncbi:MAG: UvrB/UvrC motif-containing protein [Lentisphaerae bacterium]|nr:UvrB/UvrC motif-containing protein [Lentisphaerota bacterium]
MKCEICECNDASVHFKQVCNGQIKEMYVCEECAAENGFDLQSPLSMPDFLFGAGLQQDKQAASKGKTCLVCGSTGKDFKKRSLLGCPSCYEAFAEELSPYLRAMQKGVRHVGKAPAGEALTAEIAAMQQALERAVSSQDFEEAATLRDRIRDLRAQRNGGEGGDDGVC